MPDCTDGIANIQTTGMDRQCNRDNLTVNTCQWNLRKHSSPWESAHATVSFPLIKSCDRCTRVYSLQIWDLRRDVYPTTLLHSHCHPAVATNTHTVTYVKATCNARMYIAKKATRVPCQILWLAAALSLRGACDKTAVTRCCENETC